MKSCDKKMRNKKNLKLFLAGSAMLLLASCSSAPAVLNGNHVHANNEVVKKVQPKSVIVNTEGSYSFRVPFGTYVDLDGNSIVVDDYFVTEIYSCYAGNLVDSLLGESRELDVDDADIDGYLYFNVAHSQLDDIDSFEYYVFSNEHDNIVSYFVFNRSLLDSDSFESVNSTDLSMNYNLNVVPPPLGVTFVQDIVDILVSGITNLGSALGQGISTTAQAMFINASNDGLSTWGILVASFAGLALAVGLTRLVFSFITSLGGKN